MIILRSFSPRQSRLHRALLTVAIFTGDKMVLPNSPSSQPYPIAQPPDYLDTSGHWSRQIQQLQRQLQRQLSPIRVEAIGLSSKSISTLTISSPRPTLLENERETHQKTIHWLLEIDAVGSPQHHAQQGVVEYWVLDTQQVEVTTYRQLDKTSYREQQVFHVGDRIRPLTCSSLTLEIQEPLLLYFLTRTASGARSHTVSQLPLKIISE